MCLCCSRLLSLPTAAISPQSGFTCVALGDDSAVAALSLYTQSEASLSTTTMTTTARNDDDTSAAAAVATTPDQGEEESASGPTGCQLLQIQVLEHVYVEFSSLFPPLSPSLGKYIFHEIRVSP